MSALESLRLSWSSVAGRPRLGVVLGGGATLGALEVGVIDVLARHGVRPDLLVGTSVGAINAAFWAFDPRPDVGERLLKFWLEADRSTLMPDGPIPLVGRMVQRKNHLTTQTALATMIRRALPDEAVIEQSLIPLAVVATDTRLGDRVVLRSGPLLPAVLASSAIPGLFPPVEIGKRRLADGGLVANCDIETAIANDMTDILVVDLMGDGADSPPTGVWATAEDAIRVMLRRQTDLMLGQYRNKARIAVLRPRTLRSRLFDFNLTPELYNLGRLAAEQFVTHGLVGRRVRPGLFEFAPDRPLTQGEHPGKRRRDSRAVA
jgi:NTE family protein